MNLQTLTLDQLHLFVAIVETGSFSAAAKRLHRAQSAVSYGVARLEETLGVELFDRSSRRPRLTDAGRSLLTETRGVLCSVNRLGVKAAAINQGLESEVSLAVDTLCPTPLIIAIARAFHAQFPTVSLRLRSELLDTVPTLIAEGTCDIGLSCWRGEQLAALEITALGRIPMITVAASEHPLSLMNRPLSADDVAGEMQVVVSQHSAAGEDFGVLADITWRVADAATKRNLIVAGLGWGNLPLDLVREDLDQGRVKRIHVAAFGPDPFMVPLAIATRRDRPAGLALHWLQEQLPTLAEACGALAPSQALE